MICLNCQVERHDKDCSNGVCIWCDDKFRKDDQSYYYSPLPPEKMAKLTPLQRSLQLEMFGSVPKSKKFGKRK